MTLFLVNEQSPPKQKTGRGSSRPPCGSSVPVGVAVFVGRSEAIPAATAAGLDGDALRHSLGPLANAYIYAEPPGRDGPPDGRDPPLHRRPPPEGTLGGLVNLGRPEFAGPVLTRALRRMGLCTSDPMCANHCPGEQEDVLHGAACHACLFVPETSCERGNRYLERNALCETWRARDLRLRDQGPAGGDSSIFLRRLRGRMSVQTSSM